jgi:hypothetical protein
VSARVAGLVNAGVLVFSLSRVAVLWHAEPDAYPRALEIVLVGVLYAWWGLLLNAVLRGHGRFGVLLPLTFGWSFVVQGLVPFVDCVPPCEGAIPQREIAVIGNLVLGATASVVNTQLVVTRREPIAWTRLAGGVILVAVVVAGGAGVR